MIWVVVSKKEMAESKTSPVFKFYQEVLGKDNITLAVVDEFDNLEFVKSRDIVFLRDANKNIINTIHGKNLLSTAEQYEKYRLVGDKISVYQLLLKHNVQVPRQIGVENLSEGESYFVKPRYGSDSFGIDENNLCRSIIQVKAQIEKISTLLDEESIIEEYVEGVDCTVSCYYDSKKQIIKFHAIEVHCDTIGGIQTRKGKCNYDEYCEPMKGDSLSEIIRICRKVFKILDLKHYARMDFRKTPNGELFLIDVNLLPGPGPLDHFAKCLLLTDNLSYRDSMVAILNSAST